MYVFFFFLRSNNALLLLLLVSSDISSGSQLTSGMIVFSQKSLDKKTAEFDWNKLKEIKKEKKKPPKMEKGSASGDYLRKITLSFYLMF